MEKFDGFNDVMIVLKDVENEVNVLLSTGFSGVIKDINESNRTLVKSTIERAKEWEELVNRQMKEAKKGIEMWRESTTLNKVTTINKEHLNTVFKTMQNHMNDYTDKTYSNIIREINENNRFTVKLLVQKAKVSDDSMKKSLLRIKDNASSLRVKKLNSVNNNANKCDALEISTKKGAKVKPTDEMYSHEREDSVNSSIEGDANSSEHNVKSKHQMKTEIHEDYIVIHAEEDPNYMPSRDNSTESNNEDQDEEKDGPNVKNDTGVENDPSETLHEKIVVYQARRNMMKKLKKNSMQIPRKKKIAKCEECGHKFARTTALNIHMKNVHLSVKNIKCDFDPNCTFLTTNQKSLLRHINVIHQDIKDHECKECGQFYSTNSAMCRHIRTVHFKEKGNPCSYDSCTYAAVSKQTLDIHIKSVHLKLKEVKCEQCDFRTAYKSDIRRHVLKEHVGIKSYECEQCTYASTEKSSLVKHVKRVHLKIKQFQCDQCEFKSAEAKNVRTHVKGVHDNIKDLKCQKCEFATAYYRTFKYHLKSVHDILKVPKKEPIS